MYYINAHCHPGYAMRRRYLNSNTGMDLPADYRNTFKPRVDISENDTNLFMDFDFPGISKEDIKIRINEQGILNIQAKKKQSENSDLKYVRNERYFGDFVRTFTLPDNISREEVNAKFENGVLHLSLKKNRPSEQIIDIK